MQTTDTKLSGEGRGLQPPAWWRRLAWPAWQITLEPVTREHTTRVRRALTGEIAQWLGIGSLDEMRAGTAVWTAESHGLAQSRSAYRYLVVREDRFAGVIEVRPDAVRGHVGYWLRRAERGRGTMTLANRLIVAIAFDGIGLKAVDWTADAKNTGSIAVMLRLGARLVGTSSGRTSGSGLEVRYRIEHRSYRADPSGPPTLRVLLCESDNTQTIGSCANSVRQALFRPRRPATFPRGRRPT